MKLVLANGMVLDEAGNLLLEHYGYHWVGDAQMAEIVKRWNFCEGIPREILEDEDPSALIQQVSELDTLRSQAVSVDEVAELLKAQFCSKNYDASGDAWDWLRDHGYVCGDQCEPCEGDDD